MSHMASVAHKNVANEQSRKFVLLCIALEIDDSDCAVPSAADCNARV